MPGPGRKFEKGGDPRRNNGGRPRIAEDVREALRALLPRAVERLAELVESRDDKVAIMAVREVLDRNYGKPRQAVDVAEMSDEEIRAELQRMVSEAALAEDDEADASH